MCISLARYSVSHTRSLILCYSTLPHYKCSNVLLVNRNPRSQVALIDHLHIQVLILFAAFASCRPKPPYKVSCTRTIAVAWVAVNPYLVRFSRVVPTISGIILLSLAPLHVYTHYQ